MDIDILFDFRSETPRGGDPDRDSPTLHRYHRLLWGKPLPSGEKFDLEDGRPANYPANYLVHRSDLGVSYLSSDAVIATLKKKAKAVVEQLPADEREEFDTVEHFLLQDLVTADRGAVRFFTGFDDFKTPAVPRDVETYRDDRRRSIDFVLARNQRIVEWCHRNEEGGDTGS